MHTRIHHQITTWAKHFAERTLKSKSHRQLRRHSRNGQHWRREHIHNLGPYGKRFFQNSE